MMRFLHVAESSYVENTRKRIDYFSNAYPVVAACNQKQRGS